MSLTADGVWKAGVWSATAWAAGVWYEASSAPVVPATPTVGLMDYPISYMQSQKTDRRRKKSPELLLLLLG